ncbi:MAG: hypothetical protein LBV00_02280, partial [Propionibacteriaceae bacterium]|nr:hypothetical protein [Propionibacteriaceae bacterium]
MGIPLTVTAVAGLGAQDLSTIVSGHDDTGAEATNGAASTTANDQTSVQWAAMLAPPLLAPTATFRLVMDVTNFTPPDFTLSVQAGMLTDPSTKQILTSALSTSGDAYKQTGDALTAILHVAEQLQQGQDLVQKVYEALSQDASELGSRTYAELQSSSTAMLSQIESTRAELTQLGSQAQSHVSAVNAQLNSQMTALLATFNTDVLGSPDDEVTLTQNSVTGCALSLPELTEESPRTLASTVSLIRAQLDTIVQAFDEQSPGKASTEPNCRTQLIEHLKISLGTPQTDCSVDDSSARCGIEAARTSLMSNQGTLASFHTEMSERLANLGTVEVSNGIADLATIMATLKEDLTTLNNDLVEGKMSVDAAVGSIRSHLGQAQARVTDLRTTITGVLSGSTGPASTTFASVQQGLDDLVEATKNLHDAVDPDVPDSLGAKIAKYQEDTTKDMSALNGWADDLTTALNQDVASQASAVATGWQNIIQELPTSTNPEEMPAGWAESLYELLDQAVTTAPTRACPANWDASITVSPSRSSSPTVTLPEDPADAADTLQTMADTIATGYPNCPVPSLVAIFAPLLNRYATVDAVNSIAHPSGQESPNPSGIPSAIASATTAAGKIATATNATVPDPIAGPPTDSAPDFRRELKALADTLDNLSADISGTDTTSGVKDTLDKLTTIVDTMRQPLDSVWLPPTANEEASGALATIAEATETIANLVATGTTDDTAGDLALAQKAASKALATVSEMYSGTIPAAQASCPSTPVSQPDDEATMDLLLWLDAATGCNKADLTVAMNTWFTTAATAYATADQDLATAIDHNDKALDKSLVDINDLSDNLGGELHTKTSTITDENLAMIDAAWQSSQDELDTVLQSFSDSTDATVTQLLGQMTAANTNAAAAKAALEQDFAAVLMNLGSPDTANRQGLL